jgi:predicted transcriptional regulator
MWGLKSLENEYFPKIDEIHGLQLTENELFSEKSGHSGVKQASYRKVSAYTKSVGRYKLERARRHKVRVLAEKGFTQKQIAAKLGVSTRTVKRDWDKIRPYVKGQFRREIREIVDEQQREFEQRYEGLTVNEKFRLLKQDVKEASKKVHAMQGSGRRKEMHQQTVQQLDCVFDLDSPTADGFPRVIAPLQGSIPLGGGVGMKFYAIKNGEKRELLNISISTKAASSFSI